MPKQLKTICLFILLSRDLNRQYGTFKFAMKSNAIVAMEAPFHVIFFNSLLAHFENFLNLKALLP